MKKRIVVIAPGRGSYTTETLGYLKKHKHPRQEFLANLDRQRQAIGEPAISELDAKEKFSPSLHTRGEHASTLIYACSYFDFMAIPRDEYEIVAVTGNSMGWYLAMAFAGALDSEGAFQVIQTMGSMMKHEIIGGQIIYPVLDDSWQPDDEREQRVQALIQKVNGEGIGQAHVSIWLGGFYVIGGDQPGLQYLLKNLPKVGDYPFQLVNHAAFHTPLLYETSRRAMELIPARFFNRPQLPLIDGRGRIWQPYATDVDELYDYTLGHQVYATYDFNAAVTVALKEFAPDALWLLGPGSSLGGAIGQVMVKNKWQNVVDKDSFKAKSKELLLLS
ncbi:ACP S-malonyltransferase [Oligoflexus tunisiensis]|uniref:ACP S-malonyltransferase n=1 Tax=Oligoflexus tunisiensis TaxID=708132 RepID=UPI00114D2F81|nr:ACP S-malonyltransferase [Oligoflexus tunisiensis]